MAEPTDRELELLRLVANGLTQAQIAKRQGKSVTHISSTLSNLYKKLNAHNAAQSVKNALLEGLMPLPDTDATIVLLVYGGRKTKPEIAKLLGCSVQEVERRIRYAVEQLNRLL